MLASRAPALSKSGDGQDLRQRAGLLVRRAARVGLAEHRLRLGVGVATLALHAAVVALADGLDRRVEAEDRPLAEAVGPTAAARVEQAEVVGPLAAVAVGLAQRERLVAVVEGGQARHRHTADGELGLHRRHADPVLVLLLVVVAADRRVVDRVRVLRPVWRAREPPGVLEPLVQPAGEVGRPLARAAVALGARQVGQVVEAADQVDGVVELLDAHAAPLHVAGALGPAVVVLVEPVDHGAHSAHREVVQLVTEPVVAGPAPDQGHGARELHRLVGVEVVRAGGRVARVVAEPVRALRDHLVGHDARPVVEDLGHLAQVEHVVLDLLELAHRDARERGVLGVGGEHPRIVGVAGADPPGALHGPERRRVLRGPGRASGSAGPRSSA